MAANQRIATAAVDSHIVVLAGEGREGARPFLEKRDPRWKTEADV